MENSSPMPAQWLAGTKFLFRFFCIYFSIYCFFNFFDLTDLWSPAITWMGRQLHLFNKIPALPNGSGDTSYNYVQLIYYVAIALAGGIAWSLIDRKRPNYDKLEYWFFVMLRYVLGFFMITYGFAKIFKSQFPFPGYTSLLEPVGQQSPMGLAWNFMGYSTPFNLFTGCAEAIGGFLLFFKRTTTFGALFSMTVLTNVVAMNFCYDIPVKLFSVHLLLMAILIALPDAKRLIDFFFNGKTVVAASFYRPSYKKAWQRVSKVVLKIIVVAGLPVLMSYDALSEMDEVGAYTKPKGLNGIYRVEEYVVNGKAMPLLVTDSSCWHYLVVEDGYADVKTMTDKMQYYSFKADTLKETVEFGDEETNERNILTYTLPDTGHVLIAGTLSKNSVNIRLRRLNINSFRLVNRGFHWINEYPYNR